MMFAVKANLLSSVLIQSRPWFARAYSVHKIHPAIYDVARDHAPIDWHRLVLEFPHASKSGLEIAYYQNDDKANREIATITKPGKYIKRHFPTAPDTLIRDIVAVYTAQVEIIDDLDNMIDAVINGPYSCMANNGFDIHPYRAYSPEYGWKMAVRKTPTGDIIGRALINNDVFVRCYASSNNGYASGADNMLESWLVNNGFTKLKGWKIGTKLAKIENRGRYIGPYIDGCNDNADICSNYLSIQNSGDLDGSNTDGYFADQYQCTCDDCGCRIHEDDAHYIEGMERQVCNSCMDDYFYVEEVKIGNKWRGGFYVSMLDTITTVEGDMYSSDHYSWFDIVELHNGDFTHIDNAVNADGDYYHIDDQDSDFAYCEDDCEYHTEWWQCEKTGNNYSMDLDYIEVDGCKYHPDFAPEIVE